MSQLLDLVNRKTLSRLVERYDAESRVRHFGCRQQLICMAFAQLSWREGLRDIADCLNARPHARYHLGFREPIAKSTLADANDQRDWRLWEDLAKSLIAKARPLYSGDDIGLDIENTVYALDSTTVDLSLTLFPWADFRKTKAGVKIHTQIDLRGPIPTCIFITGARQHDVLWLDELVFEPSAFYLNELCGRHSLYSTRQLSRMTRASARLPKSHRFRHSSRSLSWKLSMCPFSRGLPGLM